MREFFKGKRPGRFVHCRAGDIELPVLYYRDDAFVGLFGADYEALRRLMPSDGLHPARALDGRGLVAVAAYNYLDTTAGPYGELAIAPLVVYGRQPPRTLPGWLESSWPGGGALVMHLPVTNALARDAGREIWGYTKFIADMHFTNTPELLECRLEEQGEHILTLRIEKRGFVMRDRRPVVTYSVKDGNLIRTAVPQVSFARIALGGGASRLEIADNHPVGASLRELDLEPIPRRTRYLLEHSFALPEGQIIERNVRPLDGYFGTMRERGQLELVHASA